MTSKHHMIHLEKNDCCGCSACVNACPAQCIGMEENEEGFLYPKINEDSCINCGKCENICPSIIDLCRREPLASYAAINEDSRCRLASSSGGIFSVLAETTLKEKGVVFGAMFDAEWKVVHGYVDKTEDLWKLRGSKYVQSEIGRSYTEAKEFLEGNRKVLFSGTPCQIAGLNAFLGKDYPNLITVDVICHGVPSPGVFRWYLLEELQRVARKGNKNSVSSHPICAIPKRDALSSVEDVHIKSISFRDKRRGWKKFSFVLTLAKAQAEGKANTVSLSYVLYNSPFMRGFLKNLYLRPSCYQCKFKCFNSGSDVTLGDYWGVGHVHPELEDDKGVSIVLLNTPKAISIHLDHCRLVMASLDDIIRRNGALCHSQILNDQRELFYQKDGYSFMDKIDGLCKTSFKIRLRRMIRGKAYQLKVWLTR